MFKRILRIVGVSLICMTVSVSASEIKITPEIRTRAMNVTSSYEEVSEKVLKVESAVNKIAEKLNNKYCSMYDIKMGRSVQDLQEELNSYSNALEKLQARKEEMNEEYANIIVEIQAKALKVDPELIANDGFVKPMREYLTGSGFGMRFHPIKKEWLMHYGIDLSSVKGKGADIYSVNNGVVIFAGMTKGYGNVVMIQHANNLVTLYAHMDYGTICVEEGESVVTGQKIGAEGSTGLSTGPHLHFETIVDGVRVDPKTVIKL